MEPKQGEERERERRGGRRDAEDSVGKFHSCVSVADHRILPSNAEASLCQKDM